VKLKCGNMPHQRFASIEAINPEHGPIRVLNGTPSFIDFLDALNAWQLVREARAYEVEGKKLTPAALASVRARGADP
jgi:AICAR transformylase/IMP cyclohydrolase PurH